MSHFFGKITFFPKLKTANLLLVSVIILVKSAPQAIKPAENITKMKDILKNDEFEIFFQNMASKTFQTLL